MTTAMTEKEALRHSALCMAASDYRRMVEQLIIELKRVEGSTTLADARRGLDYAARIAAETAKDIKDELTEDAEAGKEGT